MERIEKELISFGDLFEIRQHAKNAQIVRRCNEKMAEMCAKVHIAGFSEDDGRAPQWIGGTLLVNGKSFGRFVLAEMGTHIQRLSINSENFSKNTETPAIFQNLFDQCGNVRELNLFNLNSKMIKILRRHNLGAWQSVVELNIKSQTCTEFGYDRLLQTFPLVETFKFDMPDARVTPLVEVFEVINMYPNISCIEINRQTVTTQMLHDADAFNHELASMSFWMTTNGISVLLESVDNISALEFFGAKDLTDVMEILFFYEDIDHVTFTKK